MDEQGSNMDNNQATATHPLTPPKNKGQNKRPVGRSIG